MKFRIIYFLPLLALFSSCTLGRMAMYNFSDIRDYKKFPSRELPASEQPFSFPRLDNQQLLDQGLEFKVGDQVLGLEEVLEGKESVAFLVIHRDTLKYETYWDGYEANSLVASFSMAKSYTSTLVGLAIQDGFIGSVQDKVIQYIPELKEKGWDEVSIEHVLQMTTGAKHAENYFNPFAGVARAYYGKRLHKQVVHLKQEYEAGEKFHYQSINTQILGEIVVRATGKSLSTYLNEKIWGPMQCEYPASWSIDQRRNGMEKAFCGINATAIDFAKFGRLFLHQGNWNGQQLVPTDWVAKATARENEHGSANFYQYQWWIPSADGDFAAQGHLGQFIYVNPAKDLVIVRLGKKSGGLAWLKFFRQIAQQF